jgi:hypothetical protein
MTIDYFHWRGYSSLFQIRMIYVSQNAMFPPLLESVLLDSDQNLTTYTFCLSNRDINLRGTRLWHIGSAVLISV